jgi:hypothetical protein
MARLAELPRDQQLAAFAGLKEKIPRIALHGVEIFRSFNGL